MFGMLHRSLSQHIINDEFKHERLGSSVSIQPYETLVEKFPLAFTSLLKHCWLDLHKACGHDGELQKHETSADDKREIKKVKRWRKRLEISSLNCVKIRILGWIIVEHAENFKTLGLKPSVDYSSLFQEKI